MQFRVGEFVYEVVAVEAVSSPEEPAAYGYCDIVRRRLEIRVDQSLDCAFDTLAHEYGHACEAAGIDLRTRDAERRMNALAMIACGFARQYYQQGGDNTFRKLLGILTPADEIERQNPDIDWENLEGPKLFATVLRHVYCRALSPSEFATYAAELEATQLNPFLGECYPIRASDGTIKVAAKMPGIRRLCREHNGHLGNYEWCGVDGVWKDIWINEAWGYPAYARCPITKDGQTTYGLAKWSAYAQTIIIDGTKTVTGYWDRMGEHMLALCAERQAASRVIPPMSNVVIVEEMQYRPHRRVPAKVIEPLKLPSGDESQVSDAPDEAPTAAMPDPVDDPLPRVMSMDELIAAMSEMGITSKIGRQKIIDRVRGTQGKLEQSDPSAFYTAVLGAARQSIRA